MLKTFIASMKMSHLENLFLILSKYHLVEITKGLEKVKRFGLSPLSCFFLIVLKCLDKEAEGKQWWCGHVKEFFHGLIGFH